VDKSIDKITALLKGRGFLYAGSEIYGGLQSTWDYGPLGVELKNKLKAAWWKKFVQESPYNVGVDASILMNSQVWMASGHVGGFSDPLMDCKACKERFRADKIVEDHMEAQGMEGKADGLSKEELKAFVDEHKLVCPSCGEHNFTDIREFNLMFKTHAGVVEESQNVIYLRPETAQGIFVNFKNVARTSRKKIPFGIAQIGKSFRNEITPGNLIFRTREFEQMELEFFCKEGTDEEWFAHWREACINWLYEIGLKAENLKMYEQTEKELSHYSKATTDIEYAFPFGWGELWGIANRTDYDLRVHQEASGQDMTYFDQEANEKYLPFVIEPSLGVGRLLLAVLCDAYDEEEVGEGDVRTVLRLHPALAPITVAVLPLSKKLAEGAGELYATLSKSFNCEYDDSGSIGKRYRRFDEIGTPFCITFDFESLEDQAVTVRFRDSMEQERVKIEDLKDFLNNKLI